MFKKENVKDAPASAINHKYYVARLVDGDLWFWGAYDALDKAVSIAKQVDGFICD